MRVRAVPPLLVWSVRKRVGHTEACNPALATVLDKTSVEQKPVWNEGLHYQVLAVSVSRKSPARM